MNKQSDISAEKFNSKVSEWGEKVKSRSLGTLVAKTTVYSGNLRKRLASAVKKGKDDLSFSCSAMHSLPPKA